MQIATSTHTTGQALFDAAGQFLGRPVHCAPDAPVIRPGLATRLAAYAQTRIADVGIAIRNDWTVEVETFNAEYPPSERIYHVTFTTHTGGTLSVQGIMTTNGWPQLDHGIVVE